MKLIKILGLVSLLMLSIIPLHVSAQEHIPVWIDGQKVNFTNNPIIKNGTTLVEFRPIFEQFNLQISWNGKTQTVTGTNKELTIQLTIGSNTVLVNGAQQELLVAPIIINNRTLVPIRFVSESTGRLVDWDPKTKSIHISKGAQIESATKPSEKNDNNSGAEDSSTTNGGSSTDNVPSSPGAGQSQSVTVSSIVQKYEQQFITLESEANDALDTIFNRAYANHQENVDTSLAPFISEASQLQNSISTQFNNLLSQLRNELEQNNLPISITADLRSRFEEKITRKQTELLIQYAELFQ